VYNSISATIVHDKHIAVIATAANDQNMYWLAVLVIKMRINKDGTATKEPKAHTKGSACFVIDLNLLLVKIIN
jgi:hypothetical protein